MKPKINLTYIVSNIDKAYAFEWIVQFLNRDKFNLSFILLNPGNSELELFLKKSQIDFHRLNYHGKGSIPGSIIKTYRILKLTGTQIVHTHLFDASIVGLIAGWLAGITKRIHTRHHSDFHHVYYPKAVKFDKIVNFLSTDIIAISKVVEQILINKERVSKKKVNLIHHGFRLDEFSNVSDLALDYIRGKYNPGNRWPVVGVISRYTEWKGVQNTIEAFRMLLVDFPGALLVLANAHGNFKVEIQKKLKAIPNENFVEIQFEPELFSLYQLFSVFIHAPINREIEAFGQTYVEALAAGIPSVFTLSGIANEFIKDRENAIVVDYNNPGAIYIAIRELLNNKLLSDRITVNGRMDVYNYFNLDRMVLSLELLYEKQDAF